MTLLSMKWPQRLGPFIRNDYAELAMRVKVRNYQTENLLSWDTSDYAEEEKTKQHKCIVIASLAEKEWAEQLKNDMLYRAKKNRPLGKVAQDIRHVVCQTWLCWITIAWHRGKQSAWVSCRLYLYVQCTVRTVYVRVNVKPQSTYFTRDETGLVCLPTQLERTLQLYR
jgi:hypothetical protein